MKLARDVLTQHNFITLNVSLYSIVLVESILSLFFYVTKCLPIKSSLKTRSFSINIKVSTWFEMFFFFLVDGHWSAWTEYGECTVSCGEGYKYRSRKCDGKKYGGKDCKGDYKEATHCKSHIYCPVDGHWSDWGQWSTCSKSCGKGSQTRSRTCYEPKYGGKRCVGSPKDTQVCVLKKKCTYKPVCICKKYKLERFTCLKWDKAEIERKFKGKTSK